MGLIIGGVSAHDLILDGQSVSLYVGGSPPVKVWPTGEARETVRIILSPSAGARNQLRDALSARGLDYRTVGEIPFEIELVGTGWTQYMFDGCAALTHVPDLDTSNVTDMSYMFRDCSSLTHVPDLDTGQVTNMSTMLRNCSALTYVPDMDTSQVTNMSYMFRGCSALTSVSDMDTGQVTNMTQMFYDCAALTSVSDMNTSQVTNMNSMLRNCSSLTDGNVRLIGKHPNVTTGTMITGSGLTREPFYDTNGNPI